MAENDVTHTPPPPTPPTRPSLTERPQGSPVWPTVIGVIAIVFGSAAILGGFWGVLYFLNFERISAMFPPGTAHMMDVVLEWRAFMTLSSGLMSATAAILLIAGIGILKRRRWSVRTCAGWAILKMLVIVPQAVAGAMMQQAQMEKFSQQAGNAMPGGTGIFAAIHVFTIGATIAWGWALPVFLLIWFSRAKVKQETVQWK